MSKDLKTRIAMPGDIPDGYGLNASEQSINSPTIHLQSGELSMDDAVLREELMKHLDQLPPKLRRLVLEYSRKLARSAARAPPGKQLLPFFGTLAPGDADAMAREIETGCERVDPDEW